MSELLCKILCDEIDIKDIIEWLTKGDVMVFKEGVSQFDFTRYLLEFLRKHTRLLLSSQDVMNVEIKSPPEFTRFYNSTNDSAFTPVKNSSYFSPVSERSSTSVRSPLSFSNSPSVNRSNSSFVDSNSPVYYERNYPALSSPLKNSTPVNYNKSVNNKLYSTPSPTLNNRLTSAMSPNASSHKSTPSPRPLQLEDFIVEKRKPKQKPKKRVQLQPAKMETDLKSTEQTPKDTVFTEEEMKENTFQFKKEHLTIIRKLALLYSASITSNLIQDLLKELNYIMSLLTTDMNINFDFEQCPCRCSKDSITCMFAVNTKEICLFKISLEGVYFACLVLENQWSLLRHLSKSMLAILADNKSVSSYFPKFKERIRAYLNECTTELGEVNMINREGLSDTVKFKMDIDSRPNYGNDQLFHAFRIQRDKFYEFFNSWRVGSKQPSAEFFKAKHKELRYIFTKCSASMNMFRLAELFVSQLLASTFNENPENAEAISMTRVDRLNRRFVTPCAIVVGNEKRFPGTQEFFKDFLRSSAENSFFISHVRDVLVHKIIYLNSFQFSYEVAVASEKQDLYLACINKLCLLAKFLSLITFLPYQDEHNLPLHLRLPLAEVRKAVLPPLDLDHYLMESTQSGRIIVTIPWIVEFLNGIDNTSILLPCYKTVFAKLQYFLYKLKLPFSEELIQNNIFLMYNESSAMDTNPRIDGNVTNKKLNTICASDIKKLAHNSSTNKIHDKFVKECLQTVNCSQILITLYVNSLFNNVSVSAIIKPEDISSLAEKPILISSEFYIGEMALYQCCPQLYEIKYLLEGGKKLSFKSVIPKMEKSLCEQESNPAAIDVLMETHFFDNMPKSVKSSVDSVAERISSHCVKSICQKVIPCLKQEIREQLKKSMEQCKSEDMIMENVLAKVYSSLRKGVKEELSKCCGNIDRAVRALIEPEVSEDSVTNICVDISCRKCIEIVYNWVFNYIDINDIIKKEKETAQEELSKLQSTHFKTIDEKRSKKSKQDNQKTDFQTWMDDSSRLLAENAPLSVEVLHNLRHLIRVTTNSSNNSTAEIGANEIITTLEDCIKYVEHSSDLQFVVFRRMLAMSLELSMILVFFRPSLVTQPLLEKFCKLWSYKKICKMHLTFEQILSYRNMQFYMQQLDSYCVPIREAMQAFLKCTINGDLLHVSHLCSQMLKLLRREWPNKLLIELSICLREVLNSCKTGHEKIESALEWLANFLIDDDY